MKRKRKTTIRILALLLTVVLMVTGIGIENVSAFWNTDNPEDGTYRPAATITIELMKCYHKDKKDPEYSKHYDSNGNHVLSSEVIKQDREEWKDDSKNNKNGTSAVKTITRTPRVNNDTIAGTALPDTNKYIYEYEMSYAESTQVDYAVITQPEITHYSDSERAKYPGLEEKHVRMYWIGTYDYSISKLKDVASIKQINALNSQVVGKPDGEINWADFQWLCHPDVDQSKSQQTWETIGDHDAFQNKKSFVMTQKYGENGQQFLYLLEGTKTVNSTTDTMYDITEHDNTDAAYNHRNQESGGIPAGYGDHVYGIVGLVFYRSLEFNANGGELAEGSTLKMQVYNGNGKGKLYTWYGDKSKRKWYSDISVSYPTDTKGTAYVKAPTLTNHKFLGWYAPELDDDGKFVYDSDGSIKLTDIPIYDTDGRAVLTYTDSNGQTQVSPYFDKNDNWIYKGNVTAVAKWQYVGSYTIKYSIGETNNTILVPPAGVDLTIGSDEKAVLADGSYMTGSDYTVDFEVYTNNGSSVAEVVQPITGRFPFSHWRIEGKEYNSGEEYSKPGAVKDEVITAPAVYGDFSFTLPSTSMLPSPVNPSAQGMGGYTFDGWYDSYDKATQTFGNYVGKAGDEYTIAATKDSVNLTLYARWSKTKTQLGLDYNVPKKAKDSPLGYVLTGAGEKTKDVFLDTPVGRLPEPGLTGYVLDEYDDVEGWSKMPNTADDRQVYVPVTSATLYDGSYDTAYAQWEAVYYSILYDLDGGTASGNPASASYYDELTINNPTRSGSKFLGWEIQHMDVNTHIIDGVKTTDTDTTVDIDPEKTTSVKMLGLRADAEDVVLTAMWEDEEYSLAYDYRRTTDSRALTPAEDAIADAGNPETYTRSTPTFTLRVPFIKGYTFSSWSGTELAGKVPTVTIGQGSTGDRKYTAYYSPLPYSIVYDLSGGTWDTDASHPDTACYDVSFKVSNPVLNGCVFEGWTITDMCDDCIHVLGSASSTSQTVDVSKIKENATEASGITGSIFKNLRCDGSKTVKFTAVWSKVPYTIKYNFNGGSAAPDGSYPDTVLTYTSFDISNPVCKGKAFLGWSITGMDGGTHYLPTIGTTSSESASGIGTEVADGMALTYGNLRYSAGTVTFTAAWGGTDRQLLFFGNGGTMTGQSVNDDWTLRFIKFGNRSFFRKYSFDTDWGTGVPAVSKTGYTFAGYYDSLTDGSQVYVSLGGEPAKNIGLYWASDGTWVGPSLILYARFTPKNFTVTFDINGGYWVSDDSTGDRTLGVTYDSTRNNRGYGTTDLYRPGYTFNGWTTNADGTGYMVYDIDGYNTNEGGYWSENYRK